MSELFGGLGSWIWLLLGGVILWVVRMFMGLNFLVSPGG
jgi:hypothetical protein